MKKVFHGYTERDWVALPHGREKADLKKELRPAKTRAVNNLGKDILGTAGNAIIDKFTRQATGLAYSGQTFAIKARCPACKLLYRFRWPAGAPPDEAPEDQAVAEVDVNRAEAPCGCCAEALPFIEGVWMLGTEKELLALF